MDQSQQISIPQEYSGKLREIWQDRQGVHAAAAPGYYFDTPPSYILHAKTKETLLEALPGIIQDGDTILVKASHFMEFEKVVECLEKL